MVDVILKNYLHSIMLETFSGKLLLLNNISCLTAGCINFTNYEILTMEEHLKVQHESRIKSLVSNARAIISNQTTIPLGALRMERILYSINEIEPLAEIDLNVFVEYNSKSSNFVIGSERIHCEREFLRNQDRLLDELTSEYKEELIDKCFEIIERFAAKIA